MSREYLIFCAAGEIIGMRQEEAAVNRASIARHRAATDIISFDGLMLHLKAWRSQ